MTEGLAFGRGYKRYVLTTLTLVYTLSFLDQGLMMLLVQPIKEDLHVSDTQMGLLTGIVFGLFYAVLGLPFARWADRGNRVNITSFAIGLWGLTVMSCLFVTNFIQLIFARIAAAVGDSGCMPPTYSLVGDYFPKAAERTRAMAIYLLASSVALLVSFILGGWLNEHYGWRFAFFAMGIPGLLVALLIKPTVAEPRLRSTRLHGAEMQIPRMIDVLNVLWHRRSARHLSLGLIALYTMGGGLGPWYAAFMMRSHAMGTAELGIWLGMIFGIGGMTGTLFGGYAAARWCADDEPRQMKVTAVSFAALVPCFALFLFLPQKQYALIAFVPFIILLNLYGGPIFALLQRLVTDDMRATTLAVVMLLANAIGMGVGPQLVGIISDALRHAFGGDSLRYAMLIMSFTAWWAAYHFWQVGRTVKGDLLVITNYRIYSDTSRGNIQELSPKPAPT